jgi:hypothetical protein
MRTYWPKNEKDISEPLTNFLKNDGWEVYQEVQVELLGPVADVVAVRNGVIWEIECKTKICIEVFAQAHKWLPYANLVSVCVPVIGQYSNSFENWKCAAAAMGIGIISVYEKSRTVEKRTYADNPKVAVDLEAHGHSASNDALQNGLRESHKLFISSGKKSRVAITKLQKTMRDLVECVNRHPGIELLSALHKIDHHYSTDYSAVLGILLQLDKGNLPEITITQRLSRGHLYPADMSLVNRI